MVFETPSGNRLDYSSSVLERRELKSRLVFQVIAAHVANMPIEFRLSPRHLAVDAESEMIFRTAVVRLVDNLSITTSFVLKAATTVIIPCLSK